MSLEKIQARTKARKEQGADQTYPHHAGTAPAPVALPLIRPACADLGARLPGQPCGSPLLQCLRHGDVTTRLTPCAEAQRCCATCDEYRAG